MVDWNKFFQIKEQAYLGDDIIPDLNADKMLPELFEKNPFNAKMKIFMNDKTRLLGIIHEDFQVEGKKTAQFGYFDSFDDEASCQEIFGEFEAWAKSEGASFILGPMNFSTYLSCKVRLNDFENKPFLGEPYNKEYYAKLLSACGLEVTKEYYSMKLERFPDNYRAHVAKKLDMNAYESVQDFQIHKFSEKLYKEYFKEFYLFIDQTFKLKSYYHQIPSEIFFQLYGNITRLLDTNASRIIIGPDGHLAAFSWLFPDYSEFHGETDISFETHFPKLKQKTLQFKTVGVHPKYRNLNLFGFLLKDLISYSDENYDFVQACNLEVGGATDIYSSVFNNGHKTNYALFGKKI